VTPAQLTWQAHGSPRVDGCDGADGRCYVCGGELSRGTPVRDWMGSNFTDQARVRAPTATHVCESCCYVSSRTSPVLGRPPKDGKRFGGNFRNYSHLYDEHGYSNASKGDKPLIREFLAREHTGVWFAGIADTGQKHVLLFTPLNGPGRAGRVLFDEVIVHVPEDQSLVQQMTDLLTAGATKDEITRGEYTASTFLRCAADVMAFEQAHREQRGSSWFALAIWLAQRDEEAVAARQAAEREAKDAKRKRQGKAAAPNRRAGADAAGAAPASRRQPAETLERDPGPTKGSSEDMRQRGGARNEAGARPTNSGPGQARFPGFD
jgi:hypothetical protein